MTDLEHDLKELLHDKADHLGTPAVAPDTVLRRGRRRQARTVAGGALAAIAALAVAVVTVGALRGSPTTQPAAPETTAYPARTTSIQDFTVTAPAGWTLQDLWPWSNVLVTSASSCSFSGSGTPVGASDTPAATPSQDCTTTPQAVPGGVPVLQLANFDPGLSSTLCGLADQPPAQLSDTGVALYVAALAEGQGANSLRRSCPNADRIVPISGGPVPYAAVSFVGDHASAADAAVVRSWMDNADAFYGVANVPTTVQPSTMPGPGYVIAVGYGWRLEAVVPFGCERDPCRAQAVLVDESTVGVEQPIALDLPTEGQPVVAATAAFVAGGTADTSVASIQVTDDTGKDTVAATLVRWPSGIQTAVPAVRDGWLWWSELSNPTDIEITGTDGQTVSLADTSPPVPTQGGRLATNTNADGTVTGTLQAFGRTWSIVVGTDNMVSLGSNKYGLATGGGVQHDVPGGTLLLAQEQTSVGDVSVRVDGGPTIHGWWMPASARSFGQPGRLWVVPLPGSGTGVELVDGRLPMALSWPTTPTPRPGAVVMGGGDGSITWALTYGDPPDRCLRVAFVAGDTASDPTSRCLGIPEPGVASLDDVAGDTSSLVVVTAPPGSNVTTVGQVVYPQCADMPEGSGAYAGLNVCVAIVPVSVGDVTFRVTDANGDLLPASPFTVRAEPGRLALIKTP